MIDMLVKLYTLPPLEPELAAMQAQGVRVRRGMPPEKHLVTSWVRHTFDEVWQRETEVAFAHMPVSCWIAVQANAVIGFACYDTSAKGFFDTIGVGSAAGGGRC